MIRSWSCKHYYYLIVFRERELPMYIHNQMWSCVESHVLRQSLLLIITLSILAPTL